MDVIAGKYAHHSTKCLIFKNKYFITKKMNIASDFILILLYYSKYIIISLYYKMAYF